MSIVVPSLPSCAPRRRRAATLPVWNGVLAILVVVTGFSRTFYLKFAFDTPALTVLAIVHGSVMTAWLVLLVTQASLVVAHHTRWHRRLGFAAFVMVPLMLVLGYAMAIAMVRAGHQQVVHVPPLAFMAIPIVNITAFALLAGTGIALRELTGAHRRLMLLATLVLLSPALGRMPPIKVIGPPLVFGLVDLLIIACIVIDTVRHRRLHPAFAIGGAFALLAMPAALALARTGGWHHISTWPVA